MDTAAAAAEIAYRVPLAAAADLVHHEARLLDQQRLAEWAELFTDDAAYWVPGRDAGPVPVPAPAAAGDDDGGGDESSDEPEVESEPVTCRLVTDVHPLDDEVVWDGAPSCHLVVASTFSLAWLSDDGEQRVLHGWVNHGLRRGEDRRLRIAAKKVILLDRAKTQENRPFPL